MCNMYMNHEKPECPECGGHDIEFRQTETQENFDHPMTVTVCVCRECWNEFVVRHFN